MANRSWGLLAGILASPCVSLVQRSSLVGCPYSRMLFRGKGKERLLGNLERKGTPFVRSWSAFVRGYGRPAAVGTAGGADSGKNSSMPSKRELVSVSAKEFFARSPKSSKRPNHATETSENTYRITFGKHKGKPLNQIPASYIEWLVHNRIYESRRDLKEALDAAGVLNNQDDSGAGDKPTPRAAASTVSEDQGGWSVNITAKQLRDALPPDWNEALGEEVMAKGAWKDLAQFLAEESFRGMRIYPNFSQVFRALELCPFNKTKVVILGQDPYHGPRQAEGMSFSVPRGTPIPSSLKNIYKELKADIPDVSIPTHGHLAHWAEQGVLLLNAALTVRAGDANGHQQRVHYQFYYIIVTGLPDRCFYNTINMYKYVFR
ncbi:hypothetical protein AAMO2058_000982200 [Amorphochlora amoebiformis]